MSVKESWYQHKETLVIHSVETGSDAEARLKAQRTNDDKPLFKKVEKPKTTEEDK